MPLIAVRRNSRICITLDIQDLFQWEKCKHVKKGSISLNGVSKLKSRWQTPITPKRERFKNLLTRGFRSFRPFPTIQSLIQILVPHGLVPLRTLTQLLRICNSNNNNNRMNYVRSYGGGGWTNAPLGRVEILPYLCWCHGRGQNWGNQARSTFN